ncbi:MAG TPA: hypothetical protein VHW23_02340 [Kofleriaceae bacterium]|nr:hypothetical protein [Kofleriaceae bacterium]
MSLLPLGALAAGCSSGDQTATRGQTITCTTDPSSGVVLRCEPTGSGSSSGSGANTCQDVDQDGDGEPHDQGDDHDHSATLAADKGGGGGDHDGSDDASKDSDGDGIPDDRDCDQHPGEDGMRTQLPYDVRPQLGAQATPVLDAFAARGGTAPQIVSITMDGDTWRLTELQAGTAFTVTQADCDHAGNRDVGRDRVFVTWTNADQTQTTDHLDIRYCK